MALRIHFSSRPAAVTQLPGASLPSQLRAFLESAAELLPDFSERISQIERAPTEDLPFELATFLVDAIRPAQEKAVMRQRKNELHSLVEEMKKLLMQLGPKRQDKDENLEFMEFLVHDAAFLAEEEKKIVEAHREVKQELADGANLITQEEILGHFQESKERLIAYNLNRQAGADEMHGRITVLEDQLRENALRLLDAAEESQKIARDLLEQNGLLQQSLHECEQVLKEVLHGS